MKRMIAFVLLFIVGVAVGGLLVQRHHRHATAIPIAQPIPTQPVRDMNDLRAVDAWQSNIKVAPLGDDMTALRLRHKLRREEERQRPEEGRN